MKFTSIFFTASESIFLIYHKDTNKLAKKHSVCLNIRTFIRNFTLAKVICRSWKQASCAQPAARTDGTI